ncbi:MAG: glucose 1-dehydrogenase [Alphaproteobacteria bacterium]
MSNRFDGKTVLITGGASGIGAETARCFAAEGANVIIGDLQKQAGMALVEDLGANARFMAVDVTHEVHISSAVDFAVAEFGALDVMVNNAGIVGAVGSIMETTEKEYDFTADILLKGVFFGMKHAARVMVPRRSGSILSLSSVAGVTGGLGPHVYAAAKHAVIGLTKSVASEMSQHNVRVNAVAPGSIVSPMTADVGHNDPNDLEAAAEGIGDRSPLGFAGMPIDIAEGLLYLASDAARYVTGHTLVIDAGMTTGAAPSRLIARESGLLREAGGRGT